ncbi:hypothetical protein Asal01_02362 [Fodinibius salicampi]
MTGPPEHWITTLIRNAWGLTETNKNIWDKLSPGDLVYFHSTASSSVVSSAKSSIVGFGIIDNSIRTKSELWWLEEHKTGKNEWKYVVPFKSIEWFSNVDSINRNRLIHEKSVNEIRREIKTITQDGISISKLSEMAKSIDPEYPNFPVNGSASGFEDIYEDLILQSAEFDKDKYEDLIETDYSELIDDSLSDNLNKLMEEARNYTHKDRYDEKNNSRSKTRRENEKQKRRIAKIEDYTCQVCGFRCEYQNLNGQKCYIIDVDHIIPKSDGGTEEIDNLWVLCPNCHRKKTRGLISIDVENKQVLEKGSEIEITDNHLFQNG